MNQNIAIIGCGNLGTSIANGLLKSTSFDASQLCLTRRNVNSLSTFSDRGVLVTHDNSAAIQGANLILFGLKPYTILEEIKMLNGSFVAGQTVVSLATGISLDQLRAVLPSGVNLLRAMPNTGADVEASMTCIAHDNEAPEHVQMVRDCFGSIGETVEIREDLMDAATVLGACGIAYVLRFMRAMIQGGIQIGFDANTAQSIASQTIKGAAELVLQKGAHPESEIDRVTTPKGCTIAGLNEMEHNGMSSALIKGILRSFDEIQR